MPKKRSKPGGPYYDKSGRRLPEPLREDVWSWHEGHQPSKCRNCGRQTKPGDKQTVRFFAFNTSKERFQGPLCSNCSELPPENIESRGWW